MCLPVSNKRGDYLVQAEPWTTDKRDQRYAVALGKVGESEDRQAVINSTRHAGVEEGQFVGNGPRDARVSWPNDTWIFCYIFIQSHFLEVTTVARDINKTH